MGDQVPMGGGIVLKAAFPARCLIKVMFNGQALSATQGDKVQIDVSRAGVYRIEGWLTVDEEQRPWIYSKSHLCPMRLSSASEESTIV